MKKRSTIRDVAKRAGVSPITVSRVINNSDYVSEETRERVNLSIQALNYIPNKLSQSLRFQQTNMVTLLVSDITNTFWTTVTRGVEDICNQHNLNLILCNTDENPKKMENYVNHQLGNQTDGLILVPTGRASDIIQLIMQNHIPLVILDRELPGVEATMVVSDNEAGAYQLTDYLIGLGHRKIGILSGQKTVYTAMQRVDGYRRALTEHQIPVDEDLIIFGGFSQQEGYDMAEALLGKNPHYWPTALFAGNNFIAIGVLKWLYEHHYRVPEDISLVSFDDLPHDILRGPFITTVSQNPYEMGVKSAELLIEQIENRSVDPRKVILPVELAIHKSCLPASAYEKDRQS